MASIGSSTVAVPGASADEAGPGDESRAPRPRPRPCWRLTMRNYLPGQLEICGRAGGAQIVEHDRLPVAWRLTKPYIPRYYRCHDLLTEVLLCLGPDLGSKAGPAIEHGQDDPFDLELRVQALADEADGLDNVRQTLHGVVLAL